jgi:hypothetical protein
MMIAFIVDENAKATAAAESSGADAAVVPRSA